MTPPPQGLIILRLASSACPTEPLSAGVERVRTDDVAVPIFNVTKTIADYFTFRNKIGLDVTLEALRDGWEEKKFSIDDV